MPQLALRDVMTQEFVGVSESDDLLDAVALLREEDTTSAIVLRGSEPVGVLSAANVLDLVLEGRDLGSVVVSDVMENSPRALPQDAPLAEAAAVMGRTGDPRVLVTEEETVRGVVEARDIAPAVAGRTNPGTEGPGNARGVGSGTAVEVADATADEYANAGTTDEYANASDAGDYAEQGVCESCGSLATELADVNGRLLCTDCRSV